MKTWKWSLTYRYSNAITTTAFIYTLLTLCRHYRSQWCADSAARRKPRPLARSRRWRWAERTTIVCKLRATGRRTSWCGCRYWQGCWASMATPCTPFSRTLSCWTKSWKTAKHLPNRHERLARTCKFSSWGDSEASEILDQLWDILYSFRDILKEI